MWIHLLYVPKVNGRPKWVFHNIHTHIHKAKACETHLKLIFYTNHLKTLRDFLFNAAHYLLSVVECNCCQHHTLPGGAFQRLRSPNNSSKSLKNSFYSLPSTLRSLCSPVHFSLHFLPSFHLLTMLEGCSPIMHCSVIKVNHPRIVNHGDGGVKWSIHPWQSGVLAAAAFL